MFTLKPHPDMWTPPEGARLVDTNPPFDLDATVRVVASTYAWEGHVVEPGVLLTVRERVTVLDAALPKSVVGLERNPTGRRPTELEGVVEAGGTFYRVALQTAWEWRRSLRDPGGLRQLAPGAPELHGAELVAELRKAQKAGFTDAELDTFSGGEVRGLILAEALAAARSKIEGMSTGSRAAWLHAVASKGTLPGFDVPHLGGGVDAYLDALGQHLAKAPLVAVLAAAELK